jgi:hypothetical protein
MFKTHTPVCVFFVCPVIPDSSVVSQDMNEGPAERIRQQIQQYQDMIDNYEGDDA